jgi:hypothetical protein
LRYPALPCSGAFRDFGRGKKTTFSSQKNGESSSENIVKIAQNDAKQ